jgi:NAD(P)-dependent dehydrogenase (short-subunit alcohol dehydrogenase family)
MGPGSYVVTGAGRGIGRAIAERLLADGGSVVAVDIDIDVLRWTESGGYDGRVAAVVGNAGLGQVADRAADTAEAMAPLAGWVNNAAIFRDLSLPDDPPHEILSAIEANLAPVVVGSAVASRRWREGNRPGAIVNVSSHQAQRAVRGALPYATAKAAVEGLTRALAVDLGPHQIRVNAVALGSITTARYESYLADLPAAEAEEVSRQMASLHPVGRVGTPEEVAGTVSFLLSGDARFISGVVLPVDGGRAAQGQDPEAAD